MSHDYCFYLAAPSTSVGKALAAIESALTPFGYAHTLPVSRCEHCSDDDQPYLTGFRGLAAVADRLDAWPGAAIQFARASPALEFELYRTTNALYSSISVRYGKELFALLKKENGDVFRRLMAAIAGSIDADVGCGSYELLLTAWEDGESDVDLGLILRNDPDYGAACGWGLLRRTEVTEGTRVAMHDLGLEAISVGDYVVFEDVEGIGID